jgi:hypothetical protein
VARPGGLDLHATLGVSEQQRGHPLHQHVEHGDVQLGAQAGGVPLVQGGEDAGRGVDAAAEIGQ